MKEVTRIVYTARMRDGTYRCVEAMSWRDCKRYLGSAALSIRKRAVSLEDFFAQMENDDVRKALYEKGWFLHPPIVAEGG